MPCKPRVGAVYEIICEVTGRSYIGSSGNSESRIKMHFSQLRCGSHVNKAMQADFAEHGEASFIAMLLFESQDNEKLWSSENAEVLRRSRPTLYNALLPSDGVRKESIVFFVDEALSANLKERARGNGWSVSQEVRAIVEKSFRHRNRQPKRDPSKSRKSKRNLPTQPKKGLTQ